MKDYLEDLYNKDTQEQTAVHMCSFDGFHRGNYFGGELIKMTEVEVRVEKLKNGNTKDEYEVTGDKESVEVTWWGTGF